jgi:tetratricopeptide (TPR) repeat protein
MTLRYLFGPVNEEFGRHLEEERAAGRCLTFGPGGPGVDLTVGPAETWEAVAARLPEGWRPDFAALWPAYSTVPCGLWYAPVPLVALACDWNLHWHSYRLRLPTCELILTDLEGVERLAREGLTQARPANLYGCPRRYVEEPWPDGPRDIDVLFVGNLNAAVQRERTAWLGRVAQLSERWNVAILTRVYGEDYRRLLGRARVVFNRSIRGECNMRAFEAAAAGALLFQEDGNRETPLYFRDRQECVYYTADNLEPLLEYYLAHEDERRALADQARARVGPFSFAAMWRGLADQVGRELPALRRRAESRPALAALDELLARCWQELTTGSDPDPSLAADLEAASREAPGSAVLHNALGLAAARAGGGPAAAAEHFRRAAERQPDSVLSRLNLAEALAAAGRGEEAAEEAGRALDWLQRAPALDEVGRHGGRFPLWFDPFRVEWERAAWSQAGRPGGEERGKRDLLRWRLYALRAEQIGGLANLYEAALARPDLPTTRAALGLALAGAGRDREALGHLRAALAENPFDAAASRALHDVLGRGGDAEGQSRLAHACRLLSRAAPQAFPPEPWFQAPPGR